MRFQNKLFEWGCFEIVYTEQYDFFAAGNRNHFICKLKISIYRLKKVARSWNLIIKDFFRYRISIEKC